jgi:hypothetical protein
MTNKAYLVVGEKYRGELLMCDFGYRNLNEDSWYVLLKNGTLVEVEE